MSQVFIPAYLVALGPFLPWMLVGVVAAMSWLAMWLLGEYDDWRARIVGWAIVASIALLAASTVWPL